MSDFEDYQKQQDPDWRPQTSRDVPVIRTTGLMDGDWTHTAVNTQSVRTLVEGLLEEFSEQDISVIDFMHNLGVSVEWMPLDELEKVPEL